MERTRARAALGFGTEETADAERLIQKALEEDLPGEDVTTVPLIPERVRVRGGFVARRDGVLCGLPVVERVFALLGPGIELTAHAADGDGVGPGRPFLEVEGPARPVLTAERTALNFLQRLSGIASLTRAFRKALEGTTAALLDTRKTIPGWRSLEKYAVRAGGGENHRRSLSDQALIKDNHVRILRASGKDGPREWVAAIRRCRPALLVELEVESLDELKEGLDSGADILLLDNMSLEEMRKAVELARARKRRRPLLEASGGIDLARVRAVAETGVDRISAGALTHSAAALDIGFDLLEVRP
jgi:nicotinate-nucleotide pyrophosphorylase (carboxylating)